MAATHCFEILQGLNDLREHDVLCDVVLVVDNVCIPAHRAVLASFSPYFRVMFTAGLEECKNKKINISGVDSQSLQSLVNFAYTGNIAVTRDNVQSLLPAADLLELPNVRQMCSDYLITELHPSNCIGIAKFAESYQCQELLNKSLLYTYHHFHAIFKEDEFLLLSQDELVKILSSDELGVVNSEDSVVQAIRVWIEHDPASRGCLLDELLHQCVRFNDVSSKLLHELQSNSDLEECKDMIKNAIACKATEDLTWKFESNDVHNRRQSPDSLCVIGGQNTRFLSLDNVETFSREDTAWTEITAVPECRHKSTAIVLNGQLYVLGGKVSHVQLNGLVNHDHSNEVLKYNTEKKIWTPVSPMLKKRCSLGVIVYQGYIYAVGGFDGEEHLSCVERYSPLTNEWEMVPGKMTVSRSCFGCCYLDGEIYAVGGYGPPCLNRWVRAPASLEHIGYNSVEKHLPGSKDWAEVTAMSEKRINPGTSVVHGLVYVVGGHNGVAYLSSVERYHPHHNQWTRVTSMAQPRTGLGLVAMGGDLYAVGGYSGTTYLNTVDRYDPLDNSWSQMPNLCIARSYFATTTISTQREKEEKSCSDNTA